MRRRLMLAALGVAVVLAVLGVAELVARVATRDPHARESDVEFSQRSLAYLEPCIAESHHDGASWLRLTQSGMPTDGRSEPEIPRARTAGVARIAVVGESSAHLLAQSLREIVEARPCGVRYELLACGQPGSGLEHMERRFDEVMRYQPDAVVVVFGHNLQFQFSTDASRLRLRWLRGHSQLLSLLGSRLDPPTAQRPSPSSRLARFERFLRHAATITRGAHARLVATTPASNLWMPPGGGPEGASPQSLTAAHYLDATSGPRAAADALAGATEPAELVFARGLFQARAGDAAAAGVSLRASLDADSYQTRAPTTVQEMIRRVGADAGFAVRDTARVLEGLAPGGLSGWESFWDNCHLSAASFQREAAAVLDLSRGVPAGGALCGATPSPPHTRGFDEQLEGMAGLAQNGSDQGVSPWLGGLSLMLEWHVRARGDVAVSEARAFASSLRGPPSSSARVRTALAEGLSRASRDADADALNAEARASDGPAGAAAWVQRGMFLLHRGDRAGARAAFTRAATLDERREDARWLAARCAGE